MLCRMDVVVASSLEHWQCCAGWMWLWLLHQDTGSVVQDGCGCGFFTRTLAVLCRMDVVVASSLEHWQCCAGWMWLWHLH